MPKIGFVGAGATGKTTTLEVLQPLLGLPVYGSVVRGVFKERGVTEYAQNRMSENDKWLLQKAIFDAKVAQEETITGDGLLDRTPVDHLAYCMYRCSAHIHDTQFKELMGQAERMMDTYTHIFYFPIYDWPKDEDDDFRETGLSYRWAIDRIMFGLLDTLGVEFHIMANCSPAERAQGIISLLGQGSASEK